LLTEIGRHRHFSVNDVLYAFRSIRKSPGFSAIAVSTLALGIGANTAIFSFTDAVLLRPLPYAAPGQLVRVWQNDAKMGLGRLGTAPPEFASYRDRTRVFTSLAGYQQDGFDLTGAGDAEHVSACRATASLFGTLGVAPLMGRGFNEREEKVAVLSYAFWERHYARDPAVLGKTIRLNEQPYQVVGIMPREFTFPATPATPGEPPALWTPLSFTGAQLMDWASSFDTKIVARLRPGVSLAQARDDVRRVAHEFQSEHSNIYSGNVKMDAEAERWEPDFGGRLPLVLTMLSGAVGFVLLIACANVANLLIARAGARQREISIRRALGASPGRLMAQVFMETAILAVAGSAAGIGLAYGLLRAIAAVRVSEVQLGAASLDGRVLAFALALCGFTSILCGLAPAWAARQPDVNDALKKSARQSSSRRRRRLARALILAEVACSVVLLIGAGLLLRSFVRVLQVPLGFDPEGTLIVRTAYNRQRFDSPARRHETERAIAGRLSSLPGVTAVALTTHVPLADHRQIGILIDGAPRDQFHWADNALVSADYFRVMGIPLTAGRTFADSDTAQAPGVAVINQSMARQYWPAGDAVGKGFRWSNRHLTVIGVAGDIHVDAMDKPVGPMVYNPVYQVESGATTSGVFLLRARDEQQARQLARSAEAAVRAVDSGVPVLGSGTLHGVVAASLQIRQASVTLAGGFAAAAVLLALIGVYGVLSQAVAQRTREMGVRLALGARPQEIARLVVGEGVRLAAGGIAIGLAGAAVAGAFLSKLLFGIHVLDPLSYAAGITVLLAVSAAASYIPARRAARVDPALTLRED
jgi:predicted permease